MSTKYTVANPFYDSACTQTSPPPHNAPGQSTPAFGLQTGADYDKTLGTDNATEAVYIWMPFGFHRYKVLDVRGACAGETGNVDNGGGRAVELQAEWWDGSAWEVVGYAWFVHLENVQVTEGTYEVGNRVLLGYTKKEPTKCASGQHLHLELQGIPGRTAVLYTGDPGAFADVGSL